MRGTKSLIAAVAIAALVSGLTVGVAATLAAPLSKQLSDVFAKRIVLVQTMAEQKSSKPRATAFTQDETNSYLKYGAGDLLPTGLTQPEITMIGQGKVSGKAIVDLDVVRQKQSTGGWFDPTSYLTGKLLVTASGRIVTWDGKGKFELETADISGVPIPRSFLAQMVNYFTRTADNPKGASLDDTFILPANIRRIDVQPGRFILHQ
jgi:hypothetical protein